MVSITREQDNFLNKIATVRLFDEKGQPLASVNTIHNLPGNIMLFADIDLFNVDATKNYILSVSLGQPDTFREEFLLGAVVNIEQDQLSNTITETVGKAHISFQFSVPILTIGDYKLIFDLIQDNHHCSTITHYVSFSRSNVK